MPKLISSGAVQADADLCNIVEPPTRGADAGGGLHVIIPSDYATRILAGQQVPGCTYCALASGALLVSDRAVALLLLPAIVNALTAPQQAQAALLNVKLAAAVVVSAALAQAQGEIVS